MGNIKSESLNYFAQSIGVLSSIGPKRAAALSEADIKTIKDLYYYFPRRYLDRSTIKRIRDVREGEDVTVVGRIIQKNFKKGKKNRFVIVLSDQTSLLTCVWFTYLNYWQKIFVIGEWLAVSGKIRRFKDLQMMHPEFDRLGNDKEGGGIHTGKIIPAYPSTEHLSQAGLDSRGFRRLVAQLADNIKNKNIEFLPEYILKRQRLIGLSAALSNIHFPESFPKLQKAIKRLKFEELFMMELMLAYRKKKFTTAEIGLSFEKVGGKVKQLISSLPFDLTDAQKRVIREIRADMKSARKMNRLLQGDVGSGKTIVALITILIAVENGYQAAIMAPTEILAEQHYLTIYKLLEAIDVHTVLLTGRLKKSVRENTLDEISNALAKIIIGTHALIQEQVKFARLGLIVIDEQHRFGVMQRAELDRKGINPDVLVMTATPIPRTLSFTLYGDLDISILDQLPSGRKPIITSWRENNRRTKIYQFVRDSVRAGAQAYVVFPLVEESEKIDLKAAVDSYNKMRDTFFRDFRLGLLHGRQRSEEKEATMTAFKKGEINILVSTTVIEVGVDVPNATIMVIEHAERFGLTQLHQLRGRVGRGDKQSYCILIGYGNLSEEARQRLDIMIKTNDGFEIAEKDLQLRGPGEFFGTKQSGLPELKIAHIVKDSDLLQAARKEAFQLVEDDPHLRKNDNMYLKKFFNNFYKNRYDLAWIN